MTEYGIEIGIDYRPATQGAARTNAALQSINSAAQILGQQLERTQNGVTGFGSAAQILGRHFGAANQTLAGTTVNIINVNNATTRLNQQLATANTNAQQAANSVNNLSGGFSGLMGRLGGAQSLMAGFIGGLAVGVINAATTAVLGLVEGFQDYSDKASEIDGKLILATQSFGSLAQAQEDVRRIAAASRSDLGATVDLYASLAREASALGLSQGQVSSATQMVGMVMKISAADANTAAGAIRQLGQALSSGALRGDEYNSVNEAAPRLMQLLADSMGKPKGALKDLAAEGKLTSDILTKALTDPKMVQKIEKEFGKIPVSFADIKTAASNAAIDIIGAFSRGLNIAPSLAVFLAQVQGMATRLAPTFEAIGQNIRSAFDTVSAVVGPVISLISSNIGLIGTVAKTAAVSFVALRTAMMLQGVAGAVGQVIALEKALGASGAASAVFSVGMKMAQSAMNGFTAAIAANPVGAIVVGITAAVALLYQFRDAINIGGGNLASLGDLGSAAFEAIGSGLSSLMDGASSVLSSIGSGFADMWTSATTAMGPVWAGITSGFDTFKSAASSVLTSVDGFFGGAFSAIGDKVGSLFDGIDFSLAGFLRLSARTLDLVVGHFRGGYTAIATIFGNLPQALSAVFTVAVNGAAAIIEKFINNTIGAINMVLAFANKMGAGFGQIGTVELGRMDTAGAADLGKKLGAAYMGGFGNEVESGLDHLFNDANDKANQRKHGLKPASEALKPNPKAATVADASKKDDSAKKAADEAAKRLKSIEDYWKTLDQTVTLSKMLPQEAEKHTKWLELQKLYGDKLSDQDRVALTAAKDKIALKLQEIATGKAVVGMQEQTRKLALENGLLDKRKLGLTEQQQTVEDALFSNRLAALTSGVDIASKDFTIAEAALKKELERNAAIKARGDLSKQAASIASSYSPQYDAASQIKSIEADRAKFKMAFESGTLIDGQKISRDLYDSVMKGMDNAVRDVSGHFQDQFLDRIDYVANSFGGKIGRILQSVAGALSNMSSAARGGQMGGVVGLLQTTLGTGAGGKKNTFGEAIDKGAENFYDQVGTAFKNPLDSMSKGFEGFQTNIKSMFGKGGEFSKGLGNILGAAGQGAQIGDMTNSLMKGLGIKTSGTGAQLGGAVGGAAFGPIGSVVGSIAGGLIGGMLKKTKWGTSVVTGQNANGISTAGNSNSRKEYASGAAASIQDGLQGLADQFGTSVGSYLVSIGTYKDKWRVSTTGRDGKLKGGSGRTDIKDFGKDGQAEAIEYAIRDAISDGALTGLKAFTQRVLNDKNYSLDSAVSLATSYENALKELASIDDPLKYSVTSILDPIDQLIAKMKTAGASVSEVADIERLRSEKLKALTEQQLAGLKDFKDILNGEGSGVTQLAQLTAKQTEFDALKAQIASGKAVDQDTFTKLGQEIFGLSRDIYGTANSQFQSIRADLIGVSDQFASLLTSQINSAAGIATTTAITVDTSATDAAVQQQTAALTSAAAVTNETLAKILEALEAANQINSRAGTIYSGGAGNYINGVKVA